MSTIIQRRSKNARKILYGIKNGGRQAELPKPMERWKSVKLAFNTHQFHSLPTSISNKPITPAVPNLWSTNIVRTIMRNHWPNPSENKRVKKFGWKARMSTRGGRRIIMRRILKGRFVLTH